MFSVLKLVVLAICSTFLAATSSLAAGVQYTLTDLGNDHWRYDFTLLSTQASPSFDEFTIYFDSGNYRFLTLQSSSSGWDSVVIEPDTSIPADGYLDGLRLDGPMPAGTAASGFAVTFSYVPGLRPGVQSFDLIDSANFTVVASGLTVLAVPEPTGWVLLMFGLAGMVIFARTQRRAASGLAESARHENRSVQNGRQTVGS